MLDAWIIEAMKRRERRQRDERAWAELPIAPPEDLPEEDLGREAHKDEVEERGVVIVDYRL